MCVYIDNSNLQILIANAAAIPTVAPPIPFYFCYLDAAVHWPTLQPFPDTPSWKTIIFMDKTKEWLSIVRYRSEVI